MKSRLPQLPLRLDAELPDTDARWSAGGCIAHLGTTLTLTLDTTCREPTRVAGELHLPLPPAATPRQIRDAAESWLREEARRTFAAILANKSALAGRRAPGIVLAFGKRSDWVRSEGEALRCHWRLIEQSPAVVEQVLGCALNSWQPAPACDDLFALV